MEKSNPYRKWVKMLNVLDYHRWNYVKKILPHKKHGEGIDGHEVPEGGDEEEVNPRNKGYVCNGDVCTLNNSQPEEKGTKESIRKGCASRLRAKISKEVTKKRLRHRRSSTCSPTVGLTDNDSNLDIQPVNELQNFHEGVLHSEKSLPVIKTKFVDLDENDDTSCAIKQEFLLDGENDKESELKVGEDSSDDEPQFPLELKSIENLGRSATFHQSKQLLDAMDVLSMNKDFFLKVLVDPEASLAQHFIVQHTSDKLKYLDQSRTFPRPCPSGKKDLCSSLAVKPNGKMCFEENRRKSFGHLRQKIKHVIKESKKETHRIAMDSVLHKVPYGQQYPEPKKDVVEHLNLDMKVKKHHIVNRWPSLNESMERYCKLIETSLSKDSKHITNSNSLKLRVKNVNEGFGRMSSSPDLLMCLRSPIDETYGTSPSTLPNSISLRRRSVKASKSFNDLNSQLMLSCFEKIGIQNEVEGINESDDENNDTQSPTITIRLEEPSPTFVPDTIFLEDLRSSKKPIVDSTSKPEKGDVESLDDNLPKSSLHVRVQEKDKEHFNYVKCILQLSGYLENQALGTWASKNQPVDSSLFTMLEGCSLQEPDLAEAEEGTRCNRLLLFESINEVLLSTYERSMAYWSSPLTSCSRIHPMPKGYCVLEMVWSHISWYLNSAANQLESSLDRVIMHDLADDDGWMNLQFDAEGTVLELENLIFEEILMESYALMSF